METHPAFYDDDNSEVVISLKVEGVKGAEEIKTPETAADNSGLVSRKGNDVVDVVDVVDIIERDFSEEEIKGLIKMGKEIGKGGFATVYKSTLRDEKTGLRIQIAIKEITHKSRVRSIFLFSYEREVKVLRELRRLSPGEIFYPQLLGTFSGLLKSYIVTRFIEGIHPNETITSENTENNPDKEKYINVSGVDINIVFIIEELYRHISTLHNFGIVHGDLHMANVIVSSEKKVYLIDFGLSCFADDKDYVFWNFCPGLRILQAPERFYRDDYNSDFEISFEERLQNELWCLGNIVYFLIAGSFPCLFYIQKLVEKINRDCPDLKPMIETDEEGEYRHEVYSKFHNEYSFGKISSLESLSKMDKRVIRFLKKHNIMKYNSLFNKNGNRRVDKQTNAKI